MAKPKIKHTITRKEWNKKHKDFKMVAKDGTHYIMMYDDKVGTHLVPVNIIDESINEADVVGKTVFSDGKGKLFFGYYKTDDGVTFVDYKTWKKLNFKDVSKGDTNKDRVISAILKNQKQFNKKVDYNMWVKKTNPSFEQKMDWFIQNGWISNINKGGIKESVTEAKAGDFEMGDFVHFKSKNKTGMVKRISGDKVTIMTMKGDFTGDIKDVQVLYQDDVNSKIKLTDLVKEANVETYHKSYTHAIEAAKAYALKKGYEIEDDEMFTKVGVGSKRPSVGKTTRVSLELMKGGKPQRKMLHIQVYGMKNGYELNAYIN